MCSMCKYVVVACGYAHFYLRECVNTDYRVRIGGIVECRKMCGTMPQDL